MLLEKKRLSKRKMAFFTLACRFLNSRLRLRFPSEDQEDARKEDAEGDSSPVGEGPGGTMARRKQRCQSESNATDNAINTAPRHNISLGEGG